MRVRPTFRTGRWFLPGRFSYLQAGLAAGQQIRNGAVALRVPDLGVALVLLFDKLRVVGFIELPFHI